MDVGYSVAREERSKPPYLAKQDPVLMEVLRPGFQRVFLPLSNAGTPAPTCAPLRPGPPPPPTPRGTHRGLMCAKFRPKNALNYRIRFEGFCSRLQVHPPQHLLYFLPLPQGQGSFRPVRFVVEDDDRTDPD